MINQEGRGSITVRKDRGCLASGTVGAVFLIFYLSIDPENVFIQFCVAFGMGFALAAVQDIYLYGGEREPSRNFYRSLLIVTPLVGLSVFSVAKGFETDVAGKDFGISAAFLGGTIGLVLKRIADAVLRRFDK